MPKLRVTVNDGTEDRVFDDWGPHTINMREARDIEKAYGKPFAKFGGDLDSGSAEARQVLGWSLLKRESPHVRMSDLDDLPVDAITTQPYCEECGEDLAFFEAQQRLVHPGWVEELDAALKSGDKEAVAQAKAAPDRCPTSEAEPNRPTQGADPVLSAPTSSLASAESTNGDEGTSPTSPTSSASDPGSGTPTALTAV